MNQYQDNAVPNHPRQNTVALFHNTFQTLGVLIILTHKTQHI